MFALISYAVDRLAISLVKAFKRFIGSFRIELTVTTIA
jgi:hypothetical protein